MTKAILILGLLFILIGCSTDNNESIPYSSLYEVLINHEYILEVTPVTQITDPITGYYLDNFIIVYRIRYISDEYEVMGYVVTPYDYMHNKYPILIFNRGGHNLLGIPSNAVVHEEVGLLAMHGYIVMASQYRGVLGGTGADEFGGDDIRDVLALIDISESFFFAQQGGVFMAGASRGGLMTYIALRKDSRIRAAAVWAAVANSFDFYNERLSVQSVLSLLIGGTPDEFPEEYERRSPTLWANEINTPILIGHGTNDWIVPYSHSINMATALERYGNPHKLILYPGISHAPILEFLEEADRWFRLHSISLE